MNKNAAKEKENAVDGNSICLAKDRWQEKEPARSVEPAIKSRLVCAGSSSPTDAFPVITHPALPAARSQAFPLFVSFLLDSPHSLCTCGTATLRHRDAIRRGLFAMKTNHVPNQAHPPPVVAVARKFRIRLGAPGPSRGSLSKLHVAGIGVCGAP